MDFHTVARAGQMPLIDSMRPLLLTVRLMLASMASGRGWWLRCGPVGRDSPEHLQIYGIRKASPIRVCRSAQRPNVDRDLDFRVRGELHPGSTAFELINRGFPTFYVKGEKDRALLLDHASTDRIQTDTDGSALPLVFYPWPDPPALRVITTHHPSLRRKGEWGSRVLYLWKPGPGQASHRWLATADQNGPKCEKEKPFRVFIAVRLQ